MRVDFTVTLRLALTMSRTSDTDVLNTYHKMQLIRGSTSREHRGIICYNMRALYTP